MASYERTDLWKRTLGSRSNDHHHRERDLLRTTFEKFRERVKPIAASIAHDLPDFTIHDVSHLDALWEYADLIAGPETEINPCEAFVLGGAFLIHDLGMGLAAYPDGFAKYKSGDKWRDAIARLRKDKSKLTGTPENNIVLESSDELKATVDVLRQVHAERANELALEFWRDPSTEEKYYLIDNVELRNSFGPVIGRIAHSHWWNVEELITEFPATMGADTAFPIDWTVDPLKLGCLLRLADFAHLDDRRAPAFHRILHSPNQYSDLHWQFQGKLYQPRLEGDRLVYTAKSGFPESLSSAWWICFDTLVGLDQELRRVDSLLADQSRERFDARGVSQIDDPSRLAKLIPTVGWTPVDTRIRVSAVAQLVSKLGGQQLYGDSSLPPLRELLQNATDAIHARRVIDKEHPTWGEIVVRAGEDRDATWIEVEDCGVGMSQAVLTGPFLDFGTSFWSTPLFHKELPGVESAGFEPIGKFGIGFYSVFMWGSRVQVITQKFDHGRADTLVLEFRHGLAERPLLRVARPTEYLRQGGTKVRIWFKDPKMYKKLLERHEGAKLTLGQLCAAIYPAADVDVVVEPGNGDRIRAVSANDWLTIPPEILFERISHLRRFDISRPFQSLLTTKLLPLRGETGNYFGRAALTGRFGIDSGIITVGGLRAGAVQGVFGILTGEPIAASRDVAMPNAPESVLTEWASTSWADALSQLSDKSVLSNIAGSVSQFAVDISSAPLARHQTNWLTENDLCSFSRTKNDIILVQDWRMSRIEEMADIAWVDINHNVIVLNLNGHLGVSTRNDTFLEWPSQKTRDWRKPELLHRALCGIAAGWNCSVDELWDQMPDRGPWESTPAIEVGRANGKSISVEAHVLVRPSSRGS